MEIEVGATQEELEQENSFGSLPEDTYEAMIVDAKPTEAKSGRPMIEWQFEIINHSEYSGRIVYERTVLPWHDGHEFVTSGSFRLTNLSKAIGVEWEGKKLYTEDYIGKTLVILVVPSEFEGKPGNEIKKFIK